MTHQPLVERRDAQPYVGIRCDAENEPAFRAAVDDAFPALFAWLSDHRIEPVGPPFIRYLVLSADGEPREFEVAVPVPERANDDGRVRAGALPGGSYVTLLHVGPYTHESVPDLADAHAGLLKWAEGERVAVDRWELERGTGFRACVERYLNDASREPDWTKWRTELAYLTLGP
jgi:hypothetical protein